MLSSFSPSSLPPSLSSVVVDSSSLCECVSCFLTDSSIVSSLSSQHHCRNCGKSVCTQCSSKRAPLPEFGIKQPTRVCDLCYKNLAPSGSSDSAASSSKGAKEATGGSSDLPEEYLRSSLAKEPQVPSGGHSEDIKMQEEDDLQLAIAMSLNEQDNKVLYSCVINSSYIRGVCASPIQKKTSSSSKSEPSPAPPPSSTAPSAPPPSTPSLYSSIAQEAANTVSPPSCFLSSCSLCSCL